MHVGPLDQARQLYICPHLSLTKLTVDEKVQYLQKDHSIRKDKACEGTAKGCCWWWTWKVEVAGEA